MSDQFKRDDIDDLFHDSLRDGERTPSLPVWEKIEAGLDKDRRRRALVWWSSGSVAVLVLICLAALWLWPARRLPMEPVRSGLAGRECHSAMVDHKQEPKHFLTPIRGMSARADGSSRSVQWSTPFERQESAAFKTLPITSEPDRKFTDLPLVAYTLAGQELPFPPRHIGSNSPEPARALTTLHRQRPKFAITDYLSQELAGYSLADHDSTGPHGKEIEERENSSFSTSVGLLATYNVSRHWAIESGFSLSRSISVGSPGKAAAVKDMNGNVSYQVFTVTGYGYVAPSGATNIGDTAMTGKITGRLDYVSVPLALSWTWMVNRFFFLAGAGLSTNFLTRATVQASLAGPGTDDHIREVQQYGLKKISFGALLKGECQYQFATSYSIAVMATFKSSVGPVNTHTSYSTYPYNLGLGIGLTRNF